MLTKLSAIVLAAALVGGCKKEDKPAANAPSPSPAPTAANPPAPGATVTPPAVDKLKAPPADAPASPVLGKPAPDFKLKALDGSEVSLASFKGKTVVLEWFNPQCPFVVNSHTKGSLVSTAKKHTDAGVVWLAINSGGEGKQGFDPAVNEAKVKEWNLSHPVLRDVDGAVGKAYGATNTPNMFVIDPAGTVVYAGAIDNSPDGEGQSPMGGTLVNHVDAALSDLAAGKPVAVPLTKPYGCGVKYAS